MLDSLQHHCSNYFLSRYLLLESMRMLMKYTNTEWPWSENKSCLLSFFPFLFIVLCIGLIHELGGVLNFLSSLNDGLTDRNVVKHCYVLDIAILSVYLMELLLCSLYLSLFSLHFCNSPIISFNAFILVWFVGLISKGKWKNNAVTCNEKEM